MDWPVSCQALLPGAPTSSVIALVASMSHLPQLRVLLVYSAARSCELFTLGRPAVGETPGTSHTAWHSAHFRSAGDRDRTSPNRRTQFGVRGHRHPNSYRICRVFAWRADLRRTLLHRRIRAAAINRVLSRCHRGRGVEFARARMQHDSVKMNLRPNAPSTPPCLPTRPGQ